MIYDLYTFLIPENQSLSVHFLCCCLHHSLSWFMNYDGIACVQDFLHIKKENNIFFCLSLYGISNTHLFIVWVWILQKKYTKISLAELSQCKDVLISSSNEFETCFSWRQKSQLRSEFFPNADTNVVGGVDTVNGQSALHKNYKCNQYHELLCHTWPSEWVLYRIMHVQTISLQPVTRRLQDILKQLSSRCSKKKNNNKIN